MKRGEIWWVAFDPAVAGEIRKTRPAVIVSADVANRHLNRLLVVPLTSSTKRLYASEATVRIGERTSKAAADQLTTVAKERLSGLIGSVSPSEMRDIERAIRLQLELS